MQDHILDDAGVRPIDHLIAVYADSHRHPVNELIHCLCVPAIVFTVLGLLWSWQPLAAAVAVAASLLYYLRLSPSFALGMAAMSAAMLWLLSLLPQHLIGQLSLAVFVVAWIGQFIGHKIEGKKPSFFDDLRFLLIGPLFVLGILYRRLGIHY